MTTESPALILDTIEHCIKCFCVVLAEAPRDWTLLKVAEVANGCLIAGWEEGQKVKIICEGS